MGDGVIRGSVRSRESAIWGAVADEDCRAGRTGRVAGHCDGGRRRVVVEAIGTAAGVGGAAMKVSSRVLMRVAAVVISTLIALEVGLRIRNPFPFRVRGDHIVLPVHQTYTITHEGAIKIDPVTHVTKNSLGFRGPEPPRDWSKRLTILTIGGSTTECLFLSDGRTWTDQLSRRVTAVRPDVWINNAGFEGHSTFGHLVLLREFVVSMHPKMILVLSGYNDLKLGAALPRDGEFNPQNLSAG